MQDGVETSPTHGTASEPEELPYVVELWEQGNAAVTQVLARALSAQLAQEIFKAAKGEHPERRITLRKGSRIVADSAA